MSEFSNTEILKLWPQAYGELYNFAASLESRNMGLTADQLRMALQLAQAHFTTLELEQDDNPYNMNLYAFQRGDPTDMS